MALDIPSVVGGEDGTHKNVHPSLTELLYDPSEFRWQLQTMPGRLSFFLLSDASSNLVAVVPTCPKLTLQREEKAARKAKVRAHAYSKTGQHQGRLPSASSALAKKT
ncbi:hypothetical protein OUZ56_002987 [Daphnia magna]|uniref:Uncharacterized protein n=1 Tax=Daphnia magna TaxID=35525 RepID=A0ABR0A7P0_9CRUS|nr:hypothetical protein OUZ56_002987 [Daphnia magna]